MDAEEVIKTWHGKIREVKSLYGSLKWKVNFLNHEEVMVNSDLMKMKFECPVENCKKMIKLNAHLLPTKKFSKYPIESHFNFHMKQQSAVKEEEEETLDETESEFDEEEEFSDEDLFHENK